MIMRTLFVVMMLATQQTQKFYVKRVQVRSTYIILRTIQAWCVYV